MNDLPKKLAAEPADKLELLLVFIFAVAPMWLMAGDWSDMDEVVKSGVGIACVGAVVTIYRIWKIRRKH